MESEISFAYVLFHHRLFVALYKVRAFAGGFACLVCCRCFREKINKRERDTKKVARAKRKQAQFTVFASCLHKVHRRVVRVQTDSFHIFKEHHRLPRRVSSARLQKASLGKEVREQKMKRLLTHKRSKKRFTRDARRVYISFCISVFLHFKTDAARVSPFLCRSKTVFFNLTSRYPSRRAIWRVSSLSQPERFDRALRDSSPIVSFFFSSPFPSSLCYRQ